MKFKVGSGGKSDTADTKVKDSGKKATAKAAAASHESVELSEELSNAIKWIGTKLGVLRAWVGRDNRDYASITPKANVKCPKPYSTVGEVANAVIESLKEIGAEAGMAVFASYNLSYRGNSAVGRLISVSEDGRLVFALEVEYPVTGVKSGIQAMVPRAKADETESDVEVTDANAGFGDLG